MIPLRDTLPWQSAPVLTRALVLANVLVFVLSLSDLDETVRSFGAVAAHYTGYAQAPIVDAEGFEHLPIARSHVALRTFTHMFLHGGWLHLIANMWFLWVFGDNVEDRLGRVRYAVLYLASGLVALAAQVIARPDSGAPLVGASGAIAGVLGAYALAFPHSRVITFVPLLWVPLIVTLPARFFLGVWFLLQLLPGLVAGQATRVAWWAHIGGFVAGIVLMMALAPRAPRRIVVDAG